MTTGWKTLSGKLIPDIASWVADAAKDGQQVHVGTDSLQSGKYTQFVTVIAVLSSTAGRAAHKVAYKREVVQRISSLRERLTAEVWKSVTLGMELFEKTPGDIHIHIDANVDPKHKSSQYVQELTGLAVSQGFTTYIKPEAWAASHAADWLVRHKGKKVGKFSLAS